MPERCPMIAGAGLGTRCELPVGHNSPHENNENGRLTWEPTYVAELRREVEQGAWRWRALLRDVLDDLGDELRSESIDEARAAVEADRVAC